jgi:RNA polymerase sigma factor (sigma-70 family)
MDDSLATLVSAAASGHQEAWDAIVARFDRLVWATARAHRLTQADAADVAQTTWLRLVENLGRIREPEHLGAWLATTARRESLRHIRLHARELPTDESDALDGPAESGAEAVILEERDAGLWRAFGKLSERCQALLRLLVSDDEPTYGAIGVALGMPIGAIGPTRQRCLEKLRTLMARDPAFQGGAA